LEEDLKTGKALLAKVELEKRQLQEKLTDLEKVSMACCTLCVRRKQYGGW
jgi:hypothetical protein